MRFYKCPLKAILYIVWGYTHIYINKGFEGGLSMLTRLTCEGARWWWGVGAMQSWDCENKHQKKKKKITKRIAHLRE